MAWGTAAGEMTGVALKGYRFQTRPINEYPERLFLYLQKLQSFFLKKEVHPYYQQLIEKLEKTIRSLKMNQKLKTPAAAATQKPILELESQVRSALEMVFIGDRLLGLLLRDVHNLLGNHEWQLSSDLTNTSPTAGSVHAEKPMNSSILDEFL